MCACMFVQVCMQYTAARYTHVSTGSKPIQTMQGPYGTHTQLLRIQQSQHSQNTTIRHSKFSEYNQTLTVAHTRQQHISSPPRDISL